MTPQNPARTPGGAHREHPTTLPLLIIVMCLVAVLGFKLYQRLRPAPEAPRAKRELGVDENAPNVPIGEWEARKAARQSAEEWVEDGLARPEDTRMSPDGKVLVPAVRVYEDKDVYVPIRVMVEAEEEVQDVPFWKKDREPVKEPPLTD
ncbi:MAG: hypothetical protein JW909_05315 [Planctomycetes bacterium]|nr:hypothetical protein [Planctomycetota bacterium]